MKLAILADIHSNHTALCAVLKEIDSAKVDGIVFLGDFVSDFPNPQKTLELLRACQTKYRTWLLRGNREDYMIERHRGQSRHWAYGSQYGSLLYTYENLTDADIHLFAQMPIVATVSPSECKPFTICHASPASTREWIFDDKARMEAYISALATDLLICGHTHMQKAFSIGQKGVVFSGSVGLTVGAPGIAQYLLLEQWDTGWQILQKITPYDVELALSEFDSSGFRQKAGLWARAVEATVKTGRNACLELLQTASRHAQSMKIPANSPIPEEFWIVAAMELGI